jgi:hypothetical protein
VLVQERFRVRPVPLSFSDGLHYSYPRLRGAWSDTPLDNPALMKRKRLKRTPPSVDAKLVDQVDLAKVGRTVDSIPVSLGYRIIDLFSGQLYSNPSKAIEELIVNSYDAFAETCQVLVPDNPDDPRAMVVVWDDGDSMDLDGLKELWMIADSNKRELSREKSAAKRGRLPIGRFGIGKLASYVIGRRISHICKNKNKYLIVTMNYRDIIPDDTDNVQNPQIKSMTLDVRELSEDEARASLDFCLTGALPGGVRLPLFGKAAPKTWTLVVVDNLKPRVREIHRGRLKWIISTALPLVPNFQVVLNGTAIEPSKLKQKVLKRWQVGVNDKVAKKLSYTVGSTKFKPPLDRWIEIPGVGKINGELQLFEDTLTGGKAEEYGRSHGFFVKVRQRLINYKDEVFGSHALAHQTLNRLNAVVYADGLDSTLVASREGISTEQQDALLKYMVSKFYEIRDWYENWLVNQSKEETVAERVQSVAPTLIAFPLRHAVETAAEPSAPLLHTISRPIPGTKAEKTIKGFETAFLEPDAPMAIFNPATGIITLNESHPFCANYRDSQNLHVIATAEIMTEAYMIELGITPERIHVIMKRRDDLLRELVRSTPEGVDMVAQRIKDAVHDEEELELACHSAFRTLGFQVTPMGAGPKKPDGLASAPLGIRETPGTDENKSRSYVVVYDAKSTGGDKVKSAHLDLAGIKNHRNKFGARYPERSRYSAVIAPGFEGEDDNTSKANVEAEQEKVTLIRARNLAELLEASGRLTLSLDSLRGLFEKCHTALESAAWIEEFSRTESKHGMDRLLLDTIWKVQNEEQKDPPQVPAIRERSSKLKRFSTAELIEILKSFERLVPNLVTVYGTVVYLNQPPEIVVHHINQRLRAIQPKESKPKPRD